MSYDLTPERTSVTVDDLSIEVVPVVAWPVAHLASGLAAAYYAAKPGDPELAALRGLYEVFVTEAQPSWDVTDHRGRIPATPAGMLRLPLDLALGLVMAWLETLIPKATAADTVLPPGPVRDAVNTELKKAKRRKKG